MTTAAPAAPKIVRHTRQAGSKFRILIYGPSKVGKTTFAANCHAPGKRTLLLATERGYEFLDDIDVLSIDKWSTFTDAVDGKIPGVKLEDYDTLAIDTGMGLADMLQDVVCRDAGVAHPMDAGDRKSGALYDQIGLKWGIAVAKLERKGTNLVWILPEKPITIRTGVVRTVPDMPGTTMKMLTRACDFEGHVEERDGKRILNFDGGRDLHAGKRDKDLFKDGWCLLDGQAFYNTVTKERN